MKGQLGRGVKEKNEVPKGLMTEVFLVKLKTGAPSKGGGTEAAERRGRNFCNRWRQAEVRAT